MLSGRAKACLTLAGAILLLVAILLAHPETGLYPPCLFHKLTGLHCAGCGSTRAMHNLLRGNLAEALGHNPLLVLVLPALAYGLVLEVLQMAGVRALPRPDLPARWVWGLVALIIIYWIVRNIPFYPFDYLAP